VPSITAALRRALDGKRPARRRDFTWEASARALADVWREVTS
jgi:hypothetical protein